VRGRGSYLFLRCILNLISSIIDTGLLASTARCVLAAATWASSLDRNLVTLIPLMASSRELRPAGAGEPESSPSSMSPILAVGGGGGGGAEAWGGGGGGGAEAAGGGGGGGADEGGGGGGAAEGGGGGALFGAGGGCFAEGLGAY
jgi:hypothetical protein